MTVTTSRNEAAEKFQAMLAPGGAWWDVNSLYLRERLAEWLPEMLAAERRATVERIRGRLMAAHLMPDAPPDEAVDWPAILDEEAAR